MTMRLTQTQRWVTGIIGAVLLVSLFSFLIVRSQQLSAPASVTIGRAQSGSTITLPPGTTIHITVGNVEIVASHPSGVLKLVSRSTTQTTFRAMRSGNVSLRAYGFIPFPPCRYCASSGGGTASAPSAISGGPCLGCTGTSSQRGTVANPSVNPGGPCIGCSTVRTSATKSDIALPILPAFFLQINVVDGAPVPSFTPGPSATPNPTPLVTPSPTPGGMYRQVTVQDNNQTWYVPVGTTLERLPANCTGVICQSLSILQSSNPQVLQELPSLGFAGEAGGVSSPTGKPLLTPPVATFHPILGVEQRWQAIAPGTSVLTGTVSSTCTGGAMCPDYILVFRLTVVVTN